HTRSKRDWSSDVCSSDLSFTIEDGEIMGMIGQNGAGKTTTFRLILDFLSPDNGHVLWNGKPLTKNEYNSVGYLPEERGLYPKVRSEERRVGKECSRRRWY